MWIYGAFTLTENEGDTETTRKHSSRMRTVRCSDRRGGGGCTCRRSVTAGGVPARRVYLPGGVSQHALGQTLTPPP